MKKNNGFIELNLVPANKRHPLMRKLLVEMKKHYMCEKYLAGCDRCRTLVHFAELDVALMKD